MQVRKRHDRVFAEQQIAVRYQVDVGDLYDFHQNVFSIKK